MLGLLPLAGCTTTQERSAALAQSAGKAAEAKRFNVGRTNRLIRVEQVATLKGDGANAVAVKIVNRSSTPQVIVRSASISTTPSERRSSRTASTASTPR